MDPHRNAAAGEIGGALPYRAESLHAADPDRQVDGCWAVSLWCAVRGDGDGTSGALHAVTARLCVQQCVAVGAGRDPGFAVRPDQCRQRERRPVRRDGVRRRRLLAGGDRPSGGPAGSGGTGLPLHRAAAGRFVEPADRRRAVFPMDEPTRRRYRLRRLRPARRHRPGSSTAIRRTGMSWERPSSPSREHCPRRRWNRSSPRSAGWTWTRCGPRSPSTPQPRADPDAT